MAANQAPPSPGFSRQEHWSGSLLGTLLSDNRPCLAIGWCCCGSRPKATNCPWVTVSGPAQPLVSAAVGPIHKKPTVNYRALVGHSANSWWSGGPEVELRKEATPLSSAFSQRPSSSLSFGPVGELRGLEDWVLCSAGLQSLHQGYPVALRQWQTSPIPVPVT